VGLPLTFKYLDDRLADQEWHSTISSSLADLALGDPVWRVCEKMLPSKNGSKKRTKFATAPFYRLDDKDYL
jgi:hypothetical protein